MAVISYLVRDFAVSQERRLHPDLPDTPLILIEAGRYRPKVIAPDATARHAGVKAGMWAGQARALCPQAQLLPVEEARYRRIFLEITARLVEITARIEPEYQPTSAVWYSDDRGALAHVVEAIQQQSGITVQIGIASTRFPARVAAGFATAGQQIEVEAGTEAAFLAGAPVNLLPLDAQMRRRLPLLGIDTLGQLAALPGSAVQEQFGKHGRWLHDLARGKDIRPLHPYQPPLTWQQRHDFEDGVTERGLLMRVLEEFSLRFRTDLPAHEAQQVLLLVKTRDKRVLEQQRQAPQAIRDNLYLLRLLLSMLDTLPIQAPVVEIEVRLGEIRERQAVQLSLFDERKPIQSLEQIAPEWARRHRAAAFYRLALTGDDHLPERQIEQVQVSGA
jgi:DNA polymerase-4